MAMPTIRRAARFRALVTGMRAGRPPAGVIRQAGISGHRSVTEGVLSCREPLENRSRVGFHLLFGSARSGPGIIDPRLQALEDHIESFRPFCHICAGYLINMKKFSAGYVFLETLSGEKT